MDGEDPEGDPVLRKHSLQVTDLRGIMPRAVEELFKAIEAKTKPTQGAPQERGPQEGGPQEGGSGGPGSPGGPRRGGGEEGVEVQLTATLVEIYNERIRDLLDPSRGPLAVREAPSGQTVVADATEAPLVCYEQAMQ
ncbi:hypothetical protein, conserved, partial [Eimeria tenella]